MKLKKEEYLHILRYNIALSKKDLFKRLQTQTSFTLKGWPGSDSTFKDYYFEPKEGIEETFENIKKLLS